MAVDLIKVAESILEMAFKVGQPLVRLGVYYRPPAFNSANGQRVADEIAVPCSFLIHQVRSSGVLGLSRVLPGTEMLVIRSNELASVPAPMRGDYLVENSTGQRWSVDATRLDVTGVFYAVQAMRSLDEDWGDLTAASVAEDWGDLGAETAFEDRMGLT